MGCDIHLYVQVRSAQDSTWRWVKMRPWQPEYEHHHDGYEGWDERNYDAFSVLAGVRLRHDDILPISERRGFPDDMGEPPSDICFGDHSDSWLTLEEIISYPQWLQAVRDEPNAVYPHGQKWCLAHLCKGFLAWVFTMLVPLGKQHGDANVRIVFNFDS